MRVEIITPESQIFQGEADAISLPGKEGQFQVLENHAPLISTLKAGTVKIDLPAGGHKVDALHGSIERDKSNDRVLRLPIRGGVAEVQGNALILLAD